MNNVVIVEALLEILLVISSDGFYNDKEFIIEELKKAGISNQVINDHLEAINE